MSNDLGNKKNAILEYAKQTEVDFLVWIDSDDFFHPKRLEQLISVAKWNGYWSAIKPFCFYDYRPTNWVTLRVILKDTT